MPRMVDVLCPDCSFLDEVFREMTHFEDPDNPEEIECPKCHNSNCRELPSAVSLSLRKVAKLPYKKPARLAPEGVMPEEIRQAFAKELFDPCGCGDHAPADLFTIDDHEEDCANSKFTFLQKKPETVDHDV